LRALCPAAIEQREEDSLDVILTTVGGWPMTDRQWDESQFDLTALLGRLRASYSYTPFVTLYVGVDDRNSVAHRILVSARAHVLSLYTENTIRSET